ncbi:MAG: hypothetical protein Q8Q14_01505 [Gemmatimonadales bacterium]|nr:hypothetical protein [Gemmatimonadales bacterium]
MRLVYALILIAGFDLHWGWYVAASLVWFAGIAFRKWTWEILDYLVDWPHHVRRQAKLPE